MEANERLLTPDEMKRVLTERALALRAEGKRMIPVEQFEALCWAQDAKTLKWFVALL